MATKFTPQPPPLGYWLSVAAEMLSAAEYDALVLEALDTDVDRFLEQLDFMDVAGDIRKARDWREELALYFSKPFTIVEAMATNVPWSWEEQKIKDPRMYEKDWARYQELRLRAEQGQAAVSEAEQIVTGAGV